MEYRKKNEGSKPNKNTAEANDAYRPPTRGGRGGGDRPGGDRGGMRGRGGSDRGGRGRGGRGGGGHNEDRGGRQFQGARRPLDENSWQWKYQNQERPQYEKVSVTVDTVIPELPKDILKEPSRDDFNKKMKELDKEAEDLKITVEESKFKRR